MTDINQLYAQKQTDMQVWLNKHCDDMTSDEWNEFLNCVVEILHAERTITNLYKTVKGRVAE